MEEKTSIIESLIEKVEEYGKNSIELFKLKVIEKTAETVSSIALGTTILIFGIIFLLFANFALAFWIGEIIGKIYLGFLIVSGFYLLLTIIFAFIFNKGFKNLISNIIVRKMS